MRPVLHHSLKVARKVLKKINLSPALSRECHVEAYSNCREQGYALVRWDNKGKCRKAVFSECRNSDDIMVYSGSIENFGGGNIPSDKVYKNADRFRSPESAAQFIIKFIS